MRFDFPTIITLLVAVTGLIWALDVFVFARKRRALAVQGDGGAELVEPQPSVVIEYGRSFFPVFLIVFVLRSFIVEPFQIPSGSMLPTLQVGDFILVNKFSYGLRFPVLDSKFLPIGAPQRGDVIVFRYPKDPDTPFIKRVVGVPGDRIEYREQTVFINGERAEQELIGRYDAPPSARGSAGAKQLLEILPGRPHEILLHNERGSRDVDFTVPEGEYFVLGDNRDNSRDSRFWGTVPDKLLIGRAFTIWMHWDRSRGTKGFNFSRVGNSIH